MRLSMNKYLRRSSSQIYRGNDNLAEPLNDKSSDEKDDDDTKCKFARSPVKNLQRNVDIRCNAIYVMNIFAQSSMTRETIL